MGILTYEKRRTALGLIGIFMEIFSSLWSSAFYAVPRGGLVLYDNMRFDLMLPRRIRVSGPAGGLSARAKWARSSPSPMSRRQRDLFGFAKWKRWRRGAVAVVFVIAFDPASHVFVPDSIQRQTRVSSGPTVLVDTATRSMLGRSDTGRSSRSRPQGHDRRGSTVGDRVYGFGSLLASATNLAGCFPRGLKYR